MEINQFLNQVKSSDPADLTLHHTHFQTRVFREVRQLYVLLLCVVFLHQFGPVGSVPEFLNTH